MGNSTVSSDSGGGGVRLYSPRPSGFTPKKEGKQIAKNNSPTDDEMALVRASAQFNQISQDAPTHQPEVVTHGGRQAAQIAPTPRPQTAFQHQSSFGNGAFRQLGAPQAYSNHPMFSGFADIQARLVTAQQYVRISPGTSSEMANNIQNLLISIGQDVNGYANTLIQEHTRNQHQAGELRLQLQHAQKELLSRRQQIGELQEQYKLLNKDKELQTQEIVGLKKQLESYKHQVQHLQQLTKDYDENHLKQVQSLEDEIKTMRLHQHQSGSMQLVKTHNVSTPQKVAFQYLDDSSDDDEDDEDRGAPLERRRSSLNPEAPAFGSRSSKGGLPLLMKYQDGSPMSSKETFKGQQRLMQNSPVSNFNVHQSDEDGGHDFQRGSAATNLGATPTSLVAKYGNRQLTYGDNLSPIPTPKQASNADGHIPRDKVQWGDADVANAFQRLYEVVEGIIATHFCQAPFNDNDNMLPTSHPMTWGYILSMGLPDRVQSASHMATLLEKPDCRHFVIKRVIVDYIFNRMIAPEVFYGFSPEMDQHLRALQQRMRSRLPGQSRPLGAQRQRIIEDHAKVVQFIVSSHEGKNFRAKVVSEHASMLHDILKPMRSCVVDDEQSRKALNVAVNAAWTITSKIWTSGMTLHFFFPETATKFSYGTMQPRNFGHVQPDQMQYQQFRVMLIVTPTLSLRDDRNFSSLRTHELMKADVLVMK